VTGEDRLPVVVASDQAAERDVTSLVLCLEITDADNELALHYRR